MRLRDCITAGAEWLDTLSSTWWDTIKLERLDAGCPFGGVLGLLALDLGDDVEDEYGFWLRDPTRADEATGYWRNQILARRERAEEREGDADAA